RGGRPSSASGAGQAARWDKVRLFFLVGVLVGFLPVFVRLHRLLVFGSVRATLGLRLFVIDLPAFFALLAVGGLVDFVAVGIFSVKIGVLALDRFPFSPDG